MYSFFKEKIKYFLGYFSLYMKIYFAGSITGGRQDAMLYAEIITYLKEFGEVLTEHIGQHSLSDAGEKVQTASFVHDRDMAWLLASDIIVAEVTTPSLGVGYELGRAVEHDKKILCLYRTKEGKTVSKMILGSKDIVCKLYTDFDDAKAAIKQFMSADL